MMRLTVAASLVAAAATTFVAGAPTGAEQIGTDDIKLTAGTDPRDVQVSYDPVNDRHLIVWDEDVAGVEKIRGQVVTAAGTSFAGPFDIGQSAVGSGITAEPAVTWDSARNRWLVVFTTDETALLARDIAIATVSATGTAAAAGLVSDMGNTPGDGAYDAAQPDVAFNATADEALVVWRGDDESTANGEDEIFGQRLVGATLAQVGTNDFRISTLGTNGDVSVDARAPSVAWSPIANAYGVAYESLLSLIPNQIFGQSISAAGTPGAAIAISGLTAGVERSRPAIAANDTNGGLIAVWESYTTATGIGQIEGRLIDTGFAVGSTLSALSTPGLDSGGVEIAYNPPVDRYGIVWHADVDATAATEYEIHGALTDVAGAIVEPATRLSTMGVDGAASTIPITPSVDRGSSGTMQTVWVSDNLDPAAAPNNTAAGDFEVFGQRFQVNAPPTVTVEQKVGQADPTNAGTVEFTVTFSESVSGFDGSDVVLSGSAIAGATKSVTGGPTTYNVAVGALTADGTIIADVPAGAAIDQGGLSNSASTSVDNTVTRETVAPTVTVEQGSGQVDPTNVSPVSFTVTFSEAVSGFTSGDVVLAGSAGATTAVVTGGPTSYTVTVSGMTGSGSVSASVGVGAASDTAGNGNLVSTSVDNTVTYDASAPSVTVEQGSGQVDPTNVSPIVFTVTFSEPVSGFTSGDVVLGGSAGATTNVVSGGPTSYAVTVSGMTGSGSVSASIAAGAASDTAGNGNSVSTSVDNTVTYDVTAPSVTVEQGSGQVDPTNVSPIVFTVTFSEPVSGFTSGDVAFGGSAGATTAVVSGGPTIYAVAVSGMTGDGNITASVGAGAAADSTGNVSLASTSTDNTVTYDVTAPTVTVEQASGQADPSSAQPFVFDAVFSEPIVGFVGSDVSFTGSTAPGTLTAGVAGGPTTWTISVSGATGSGQVVVTLPAGRVTDTAGNANPASTSTDNSVTSLVPSFVVTSTLDFGQVPLGSSTASNALVRNVTGAPIVVSMGGGGLSGPPGNYANVQACQGVTLADNATCAITYTFAPQSLGVKNLTNSFTLNGEPYSVDLTGEGVIGLSAAPASLAFGGWGVGATSTPQVLTITNTSTFTINNLQMAGGGLSGPPAGDFLNSQNCQAANLAPGASCEVTYRFTPRSLGLKSITNSFSIGAFGTSAALDVSVDLSGTGTPAFSVTPSIDFGNVPIGASSAASSAIVTNISGATLTNIQMGGGGLSSPPGNYANSQACQGVTLANGATCLINYVFAPQSLGIKNLTNSFTLNGQTYTVDLTGTGVSGLTATPTSLNFGSLAAGSSSATQVVTITNTSTYTIASIQMAGGGLSGPPSDDYSNSQSCQGTTLAPSGTCDVAYVFTPRTVGTKNVTNSFSLNTVVFDIQLTGIGLSPVSVAPTTLDFGDVSAGGTSASQSVTVTNTSGTALLALAVTGGTPIDAVNFGVAQNCAGVDLAPSASCTFDFVFDPATVGTIGSSAPIGLFGQTYTIDLTGNALNDPPVLTAPATAAAELGVALALSGGNSIAVTDVFGNDVQVSVSALDATITVPAAAGATIGGNSTASVSVRGTPAAVTAALAGLIVTFSELGAHTVNVSASDLAYTPTLTDSAAIAVTVTDNAPPVISAPSGTIRANNDPGKAGAVVTYLVTVSDVGSSPPSGRVVQAAPPTLSCTPPSGSFFPIGTTTVTCSAQDSAGNTATASFSVAVTDVEKPTITPPSTQRVNLSTGKSSGVVTYPAPTATDNSGSVTVSCAPTSGSVFPGGTTTVTCTATDPSGNSATASFSVIVVSGVLPPTGGGGGPLPLALALLLIGLVLTTTGHRRRA
jgi:hypothetical protein